MTKLLTLDLSSQIPGPEALPQMTELLQEIHLNEGQAEADRWVPAHVMLKNDEESPPGLTDFVNTVPFRMASLRFVNLLRSFQCECEYLPLVVHYQRREIEGEFFALNALRVVRNAIDVNRSMIDRHYPELGMARGVKVLTLDEGAIGAAPLSFLREISTLAVNEELAQAIADAGLIGIKLLKPEEFSS